MMLGVEEFERSDERWENRLLKGREDWDGRATSGRKGGLGE